MNLEERKELMNSEEKKEFNWIIRESYLDYALSLQKKLGLTFYEVGEIILLESRWVPGYTIMKEEENGNI